MKRITGMNVLLLVLLVFTSCSKEETDDLTTIDLKAKGGSMNFPAALDVPDGFNPEGIVAGKANTLYIGSLYDGSILEINTRTGESSLLVEPQEDRTAVGLEYDNRTGYLFVAGGPDGYAYIYDTKNGEEVAAIQLTNTAFPETFINDVAVTQDAAYFTNSFTSEYYKVPLNRNGTISTNETVETIALTGDFTATMQGFNSNGIVATPDGSELIIVHSTLGVLYNVDADTGVATEIEADVSLVNGDGLVLRGKSLYVVQNYTNQISVVKLNNDWTEAELIETITDPDFQVPTTATFSGGQLYAVNAKFDIAPPPFLGMGYDPTISFEAVLVDGE